MKISSEQEVFEKTINQRKNELKILYLVGGEAILTEILELMNKEVKCELNTKENMNLLLEIAEA